MQTVDKLYVNTTNRFPLIPQPFLTMSHSHHNNKIHAKSHQSN